MLTHILFLFVSVLAHAEPAKQTITISAINYKIEGSKTQNQIIEKIGQHVAEALQKKSDVLLLPELISLDLFPVEPKSSEIRNEIENASRHTLAISEAIQNLASKNNMLIVAGSYIRKNKNKFTNETLVAFPDKSTLWIPKIRVTPWEEKYGIQSTNTPPTYFKFKNVSFASVICYDVEFPDISNMLAKNKFDVLLIPSMTEDEWGWNRVNRSAQTRAIEHHAYTIVTGTSGNKNAPWHVNTGNSALYTPQDKNYKDMEKSSSKNKTEMLTVILDISLLKNNANQDSTLNPARIIRSNKL